MLLDEEEAMDEIDECKAVKEHKDEPFGRLVDHWQYKKVKAVP
jgi:hypothetical protein